MAKNEFLEVKDILAKSRKFKQERKYFQAKSLLQDTLQKYPDNKYLKSSLADLLSRRGELEQAFNLAEDILKNNPDDSRALIVKGNVSFSKREYDKALEFFKQALKNNDSNYLYSRILRTHIKLENFEKAAEICQKKLDEDPENSSFKNLMARIYEKMGKDDKAAKYLNDYLQDNPDDDFAYKEKLKMKMKDKDPKKAVNELKALLKIKDKSNNVFLHHLLAEKLEKLNRYDEAFSEYEKSL
ncbi:MAG: tetratricopeptide repeat protein, partial [Halanaerobiales bacterium]|nr:tetratricopeptide repeat protein [Halanaerobiales bacterium]